MRISISTNPPSTVDLRFVTSSLPQQQRLQTQEAEQVLQQKPNSNPLVVTRNYSVRSYTTTEETRRCCRRNRVALATVHPKAVTPSSSQHTISRLRCDNRCSSIRRSVTTLVIPLLLIAANIIIVPCHRFESKLSSMMLFTNAFSVGALPKSTTSTSTITSTNLFVSHDFTRSASPTTPSSSSSTSSSPSIITQAGFRPKAERMGIRKRLRSVLENAKRRGGFSSSSSSTVLSMSKNTTHNDATLIVAEAASIGGLYESVDFVLVNKRQNSTGTESISTLKPVVNGATTITPSTSNVVTTGSTVIPETKINGVKLENNLQDDRNGNTDVTFKAKVNGSSNNGSTSKSGTPSKNQVQVDAILNSGTVAPLPFRLPKLTREQKMKLMAGERIQEQSKMGRDGSGYVVLDVKAPDYVVWECLLDFEKYPEYIGTVRSMQMFTNTHLKQSYIAEKPVLPGTGRETRHYGTASITRASFVLSKFLLKIAAVHKYRPHPAGHYMEFTLDKACRNVVLKDAKGIWYTECNPDGRQGYTRIWLLCELSVSRVLPTFIVDYAAKRAMPRASNWIQPVVERVKKEFNIVD